MTLGIVCISLTFTGIAWRRHNHHGLSMVLVQTNDMFCIAALGLQVKYHGKLV